MAQSKNSVAKPSIFARFGKYLKDVRTELRRVSWPTRQDVMSRSVVVIVTLLFFMVFTLIIDNAASYLFLDLLAGIGR